MWHIKYFLLAGILWMSLPSGASAQAEEIGTEEAPPNPSGVPVDGGVVWLVGSGIIYVIRKNYINNKTNKND